IREKRWRTGDRPGSFRRSGPAAARRCGSCRAQNVIAARLKFAAFRRTCAVEESSTDHLPDIAAHTDSISQKIRELAQGVRPLAFSHVTEAAQSFLVAAIAGEIPRTLWVLCRSVRSQELLYESLLNWQPNALFLPEA